MQQRGRSYNRRARSFSRSRIAIHGCQPPSFDICLSSQSSQHLAFLPSPLSLSFAMAAAQGPISLPFIFILYRIPLCFFSSSYLFIFFFWSKFVGGEERAIQKNYWIEHSADLTVEAMMLDSRASDLDREERPEVNMDYGWISDQICNAFQSLLPMCLPLSSVQKNQMIILIVCFGLLEMLCDLWMINQIYFADLLQRETLFLLLSLRCCV